MENNLDSNNDQNNDNNNIKKYNNEFTTKTKYKNPSSKTKKKIKTSKESKNEQINNDEKKHVIIQDNKSLKKETINDILNKQAKKNKLPPINLENSNNQENDNSNKSDILLDNRVSTSSMDNNKYLKMQIEKKMKQIEDLSLSQEKYKKTLIELLQKINIKIKSNADKLYSSEEIEEDKTENKIDREKRIKELTLLVEKKQEEVNLSKEINKKYKNKYENMMKEYNVSSSTKIDNFQKKINEVKESNSSLHKMIKSYNHSNYLKGKKLELNSKNNNDIKFYSDEYTTLMKEKYNQYVKLNSSKKLIKDAIEQFQYLIKMLNKDEKEKNVEKKNEKINVQNNNEKINEKNFIKILKKLKIEDDINILKEDLSGNEDNIYNRVINDNTLILNKNNKIKNRNESIINGNKQNKKNNRLKLTKLPSILKEMNNKDKKLINSRSCNDIIDKNRLINNDINISNEGLLFKDVSYDKLSNYDYEKINIKKQKYFDLDSKLEKSIKDLSEFYDNKVKNINLLLESNSKKLSNIQQENELLKSKIADYRRIMELNIKEQKLLKQNSRYKNLDLNYIDIDKEKNVLENNKEKFEIIDKDIEYKIKKDEYIDKLKEKYKVKNNKKYQDDIKINLNDFDSDL